MKVRQIFLADGRCVQVTPQLAAAARTIYEGKPSIWGGDLLTKTPWDKAPARWQIEFLELAYRVQAALVAPEVEAEAA